MRRTDYFLLQFVLHLQYLFIIVVFFFFLVIALLFKSYRAIRKIFYRAATSKNCNDYKQRQLLQQQLIVATNAGSANNMDGRMSERWR